MSQPKTIKSNRYAMSKTAREDVERIRQAREGKEREEEPDIIQCPIEGCTTVVLERGALHAHIYASGDDAHADMKLNEDLEPIPVKAEEASEGGQEPSEEPTDVSRSESSEREEAAAPRQENSRRWGPGDATGEDSEHRTSVYEEGDKWGPGSPKARN